MADRDLPRVVRVSGEKSIIMGEKHLYSPRGPVEKSRSRALSADTGESILFLLASPLLWYGVEDLLSTISSSSHILAVELDESLYPISLEHLTPELRSCERLHIVENKSKPEDLIELLKNIGVEKFRSAKLISLNGGYRLHAKEYTRLLELLNKEISAFWKNKSTLIHMAPLWIKNIFSNTALYASRIHRRPPEIDRTDRNDHKSMSKEKPVLIVGAGPSAEKIIPQLEQKKIRDRLFLIAVDTALTPLTSRGIDPDVVIVQEGQFYNIYDFIPAEPKHTFFYYDMTGADIVPRMRKSAHDADTDRSGFFITDFFPTRLFDRLEAHGLLPTRVPPLGSVGSTAVEIALRTYKGPIYVTGIDFSFYYGKTHMRGTTLHLRELLISDRLSPVGSSPIFFPQKSVYRVGEKLTTGVLRTYAETFATRFRASHSRLRAVGDPGTDLGIQVISTEEFLNNVETAEASFSVSEPDAVQDTCELREKARVFLEEEAELLRIFYRKGNNRLMGKSSPTASAEDSISAVSSDSAEVSVPSEIAGERLEEIARRLDYLFHHFPDTGYTPPDPLTISMLKRALISAGHYLKIVERSLEHLRRGDPQCGDPQ